MYSSIYLLCLFFFFQAEDGIRDDLVTGVQTCALPICPEPDLIELLGDKLRAREELGDVLPLVPGTAGGVTLSEARRAAEEVGYPVLLKAAAGGGGRGMRLVAAPDELEQAFQMAAAEAEAGF